MNLCDYLLNEKPANAPALFMLDRTYTYGELEQAVSNVAAFLLASGGQKGDRTLLLADSTFFWVATYLGTIRAGLVCVPLAPATQQGDLQDVLSITEPAFAFIDAKAAAKLSTSLLAPYASTKRLITDRPSSVSDGLCSISLEELPPSAARSVRISDVDLDDLAALMFTSGSTGRPRGVMVSHRNIVANTESIIDYLSLTDADRIMAVLPFHYCFGTSLLHTHLKVGGSVVVEPRFMYPEVLLQRMEATHCTGFAGVPSHFQILLRKSNLARMQFPSLRYVQQAGGQLAPLFIQQLREALPQQQIFIMYGQTEATARLSYLPPEMLETKLGSVGKAIPGVRLSVLNEDGKTVEPGQTGEIVAEGDNVAVGYWRNEAESRLYFRERKLYTGDLATIDEDGFIYITDRAKDFLKCGGKRVSCRYLENTLVAYPELLEAAVVGVPDEVLGEAAVAFVVSRNGNSGAIPEQLNIYCREHLPLPFVPKRFFVMKSLPKNSSGKIMKSLLKEQAAAAS